MKAHGGLIRVGVRQWAQTAERALRRVLVELSDGRRNLRLHVLRKALRRLGERARGRYGTADALESDSVEQALSKSASLGGAA